MKAVLYGPEGSERPGIIDADGGIWELSGKRQHFGPPLLQGNFA
jgi:hypothetical protein